MTFHRRWAHYLLAVLSVAVATAIQAAAILVLNHSRFLLMYPAIFLTSWVGGLGPGLVATALAVISCWYFFVQPYQSFELLNVDDSVAIAAFAFMGAAMVWLNRATQRNLQQQRELRGKLEDIKRELSRTSEHAAVALSQSEAKSVFVANMSHEIRTPLSAMMGFAQLLRDEIDNPEERKQYSDIIVQNGQYLSELIEDILDLSRIETNRLVIQKVPFEVHDLLQDIYNSLRIRAIERECHLEANVDEDLPSWLMGDRLRIRQVLMNLVGNSIKFTHRGSVSVKSSAGGPNGFEYLQFVVTDSGVGIPPEYHQRIFERFVQATPSGRGIQGGAGIGLALSRRLARAMGGEVYLAESKISEGSRFIFQIPLELAPPHLIPQQPPSQKLHFATVTTNRAGDSGVKVMNQAEHQKIQDKVKVLLVDDSADNRLLVKKILTDAGTEVETAVDGKDGIEKAMHDLPDLILMDLQMPGLSGYEATQLLRARGFVKPIVALTASAMPEDFARSKRMGCDAHLAKPLNRADLVRTIRELTHHEI
jgi:signal transduction histidine kinase/ActR/RegA family two-component response regulator